MFFDFAYHFGGSRYVTLTLAAELARTRPVLIVDAYGACQPYMRALAESGLPTRVLHRQEGRTGVGGRGLGRLLRLLREAPSFLRAVQSLRVLLKEVRPAAVVISAEIALVALRRAVGTSVPVMYYMMGEFRPRPWYSARLWSDVDLAVGLSRQCVAWLKDARCQPRRTAIVPNGVDLQAVESAAGGGVPDLPGTGSALKLLFPATLLPFKSQDVAIRAVAEAVSRGTDVHLWITGAAIAQEKTGYAGRLRDLVDTLGVRDRVSFLGWRDDIVPVIARSDAVILTSRTEGIPCSLMQAMALGKPVIATRVGGVPELVRDGVDGILVDVGDVQGVCGAIRVLADRTRCVEMSRQARERIEQSFTVQQQAASFARLVDSLRETSVARGDRLCAKSYESSA